MADCKMITLGLLYLWKLIQHFIFCCCLGGKKELGRLGSLSAGAIYAEHHILHVKYGETLGIAEWAGSFLLSPNT